MELELVLAATTVLNLGAAGYFAVRWRSAHKRSKGLLAETDALSGEVMALRRSNQGLRAGLEDSSRRGSENLRRVRDLIRERRLAREAKRGS